MRFTQGSATEVRSWGPLLGHVPGYAPVVRRWGLLQESTAGVWWEVVRREVGKGVRGAESPKALLEFGDPARLLALEPVELCISKKENWRMLNY